MAKMKPSGTKMVRHPGKVGSSKARKGEEPREVVNKQDPEMARQKAS